MQIKGQNLRIFINGDVITAAQQCQLRITTAMADVTSKDTAGLFRDHAPVGLQWEVTAYSAVWTGEGPGLSTADLADYQGATVDLEMSTAEGEHNATPADTVVYGRATVAALTVNAMNRRTGTCSVILRGAGPLSIPLYLAEVTGLILLSSDNLSLTVRK